jgi:hypothetical protein
MTLEIITSNGDKIVYTEDNTYTEADILLRYKEALEQGLQARLK